VAVVASELEEIGVHDTQVGGQEVTVWHLPGTASGLDRGQISQGRDVGQADVFVPDVDGQRLTFSRSGDTFTDAETGSTWNFFGQAVAGELEGSQLEQVPHVVTFWFAWASFEPDTRIEP
jgi:hypothetical protein